MAAVLIEDTSNNLGPLNGGPIFFNNTGTPTSLGQDEKKLLAL
jgi:hypothetical protein